MCHTCTYAQTHGQNTQPYPVGEGVWELHQVALTLVIIVHCERMSHSELRKPLNFPQRRRKKEWAKRVKGGGRGQTERGKKRSDKMCAKWEKEARWKGLFVFPAVLHWLFKEPFRSSCTSAPFQPDSSSPTNNKHRQRAGQLSSNCQQFSTWPELLNSVNLTWIHPGVRHFVEEFDVGFSWLLRCLKQCVCLQAFLSPAAQD